MFVFSQTQDDFKKRFNAYEKQIGIAAQSILERNSAILKYQNARQKYQDLKNELYFKDDLSGNYLKSDRAKKHLKILEQQYKAAYSEYNKKDKILKKQIPIVQKINESNIPKTIRLGATGAVPFGNYIKAMKENILETSKNGEKLKKDQLFTTDLSETFQADSPSGRAVRELLKKNGKGDSLVKYEKEKTLKMLGVDKKNQEIGIFQTEIKDLIKKEESNAKLAGELKENIITLKTMIQAEEQEKPKNKTKIASLKKGVKAYEEKIKSLEGNQSEIDKKVSARNKLIKYHKVTNQEALVYDFKKDPEGKKLPGVKVRLVAKPESINTKPKPLEIKPRPLPTITEKKEVVGEKPDVDVSDHGAGISETDPTCTTAEWVNDLPMRIVNTTRYCNGEKSEGVCVGYVRCSYVSQGKERVFDRAVTCSKDLCNTGKALECAKDQSHQVEDPLNGIEEGVLYDQETNGFISTEQ